MNAITIVSLTISLFAGVIVRFAMVRLTLRGRGSEPWFQRMVVVVIGVKVIVWGLQWSFPRWSSVIFFIDAVVELFASAAFLAFVLNSSKRPATRRRAWLRPVVLVRRSREFALLFFVFGLLWLRADYLTGFGVMLGVTLGMLAVGFVMLPRLREEERFTAEGPGPDPVVLLRSFEGDFVSDVEHRFGRAIRRRFGTFVAFGNGEEEFPGLGATRIRVADAVWRQELTRLARTARLLVVFPGDTDSLRWELAMVLDEGLAGRLLVIHAPDRSPGIARFLAWTVGAEVVGWPRFAKVLRDSGFEAPPDPGPGSVLWFDKQGWCADIRSGLRTPREIVDALAEFDSLAR